MFFDSMEAYETGEKELGDQKMQESKSLLEKSMSNCGDLAEAMINVNERFNSARSEENWSDVSNKIYENHKGQIEASVRI